MPIRYESWPKHPETPGGQHVSTGPSGVRGVHICDEGYETGVEACCQLHRSQFKNRLVVQEMIEWALANT